MKRALLLALLLPLSGCRRAPRAAEGSALTIHYTISADGKVYDTSEGSEPLSLVLGRGALPAGLERKLIGLREGDDTFFELSAEQAYGAYEPKLVDAVPLAKFGALASQLKPGKKVLGERDGRAAAAKVLSVADGQVVLDFNHPLAGKPVRVRARVLSIAGP